MYALENNLRMYYIAPIMLVAVLLFFLLHTSEGTLEFAADSIGRVDASGIQVSFLICNPSPMPITLEGARESLDGPKGAYGTLSMPALTVPAVSSATLEGWADFASPAAMKGFIDSILSNRTSTNATLAVSEKLLGLVPYSFKSESRQSLAGLFTGSVKWDCKDIPNHGLQIRQRLEVADAQISAAHLLYLGGTATEGQSGPVAGLRSPQEGG
ncbi:MAG: hypothetical protein KGI33_02125 [Thaumarchaeota archaeon]|nr:hypothetical protein [Nitrososphaerota archaeon]